MILILSLDSSLLRLINLAIRLKLFGEKKKKKIECIYHRETHIKIHLLIECDQNVRLIKKVTTFPIKHEGVVKETLII